MSKKKNTDELQSEYMELIKDIDKVYPFPVTPAPLEWKNPGDGFEIFTLLKSYPSTTSTNTNPLENQHA